MGVIYAYLDPVTEEVRYIGKTERTVSVRLAEHKYNLKRGKTHLYCWMRTLQQDPLIKVLEENPIDINAAERHWIAHHRSLGVKLVNHTDGGDGKAGWRHSEATKAKISLALTGKERPWARENVKKAQAACRGASRPKSRETIKLASLAAHSLEGRIAMSRGQGGLPVFCEQNQVTYPTAVLAAEALALDPSAVRKVAKGFQKTTGSYTFRFVQPDVILDSRS